MKHTPAPWTLLENDSEPCQLIGNGTIHIADIFATDFPAGAADARLIAAAPDLLTELEHTARNLRSMIHMLSVNTDAVDRKLLESWLARTDAAIAKAEGRVQS